MHISTAFPSEYLRAADLQGRQVTVRISHVDMKEIGGEAKPVLHFFGKDKGMVLNKTNANVISSAYGDDTDDWQDAEIVLFESMVDFQGKTVPALRCKVPPRKVERKREPDAVSHSEQSLMPRGSQTVTSGHAVPLDDEVPFAPSWM